MRKELLLQLCKEIETRIKYLYSESDEFKQDISERLRYFGSTLSKIGWILECGEEQDIEKMFEIIGNMLKENKLRWQLERWLCIELSEVEKEMKERMQL